MDEVSVQNEVYDQSDKAFGTNESLFWHNQKKILYFNSFVLQNLICTAYDFLCLDLHCITLQISFISASDLNRFPRSCKSHTK